MSDPGIAQAAQSALDMAVLDTGQAIADSQVAPPNVVYRRWAIVSNVYPGTPLTPTTVDIVLNGVRIPGVPVFTSYKPSPGDAVAVDIVGTDAMVVGHTGLSAAPADVTTPTTPPGPIDPNTGQPIDTSSPGAPSLTLTAGLSMIIASWPLDLTDAGNQVGTYEADLSLDPAFDTAGNVVTQTTSGNTVAFTGLTPSTAYYVRVRATSYAKVVGPYSSVATVTVPSAIVAVGINSLPGTVLENATLTATQIANKAITNTLLDPNAVQANVIQEYAIGATAIAAGAIVAGKIATDAVTAGTIAVNTIVAGKAVIGTAAIASAMIATLTAGSITSGTINAQSITLGTSGGTAAIQSANYVAGGAGWAILGDGTTQLTGVDILGGSIKFGYNGDMSITGTNYIQGTGSGSTITIGNSNAQIEWTDYGLNVGGAYGTTIGSGGLTVDGATTMQNNLTVNATATVSYLTVNNTVGSNLISGSGNFFSSGNLYAQTGAIVGGGNGYNAADVALFHAPVNASYPNGTAYQVMVMVYGGTNNTTWNIPPGLPTSLGGMVDLGITTSGSNQIGSFGSSREWKEEIVDLAEKGWAGSGNPVWALRPRRFRWKDEHIPKPNGPKPLGYNDDPRPEDPDFYPKPPPYYEAGLIVEEVEDVLSELTLKGPDGKPMMWNHRSVVAYLIEAAQSLRKAHNDLANAVGAGAEHTLL